MNALSDEEVFVLGTVRLNLIHAINHPAVSDTVESLKSAERGLRMLGQAFNFLAKCNEVATTFTKSGLIMFKGRQVVTLCANHMSYTPSKPIQRPSDNTIYCMGELVSMSRWIRFEFGSCSELCIPALVIVNNLFANGVEKEFASLFLPNGAICTLQEH